MSLDDEFPFRLPKPNRAKKLANEASLAASQGKYHYAIKLLDRAILLDQHLGLAILHKRKADICSLIDKHGPATSMLFYEYGVHCCQTGRIRDGLVAFLESHKFNPNFLWPANNYAWELSTSTNSSFRNGKEALRYALLICELSKFNCWSFLNTLAAAFAQLGNFPAAIGWQKVVIQMAPEREYLDNVIQLRHFENS